MIDKKQSSINFLKSKIITRQNTHIIHGEEVVFISLEKLNILFKQSKEMHKEEIKSTVKTYHDSMFYLPLTNGELHGICQHIINKLDEQD